MDRATGPSLKGSKTCDECKSRKVRCVKSPRSGGLICRNCEKRGIACHFGFRKPRGRQLPLSSPVNQSAPVYPVTPGANNDHSPRHATHGDTNTSAAHSVKPPPQPQLLQIQPSQLYIDCLLEDRKMTTGPGSESSLLKAHEQYVGSSGIAFFSDKRIASICDCLGHRNFVNLIDKIASSINTRMNRGSSPSAASIKLITPPDPVLITNETAKVYVSAYFHHIHPLYPFIDRKEFEYKAFNIQLAEILRTNTPFSTLYHTVLAIGCQYYRGGSFEPGSGPAWELYQVALGLLPEILTPKETLLNIQAVTAMAIFAQTSSCVQINHMLTTEAARMAQTSGLSRATGENQIVSTPQRTFWVIYILEKTLSFACGRPSVLMDSEISTPVPDTPDAMFGSFNWFHAMCRFSRLLSKTYHVLFSISTTLIPVGSLHLALNAYSSELEDWKDTVPEEFRPGNPFAPSTILDSTWMSMALRLSYHYYSAVIALGRLRLNLPHGDTCWPVGKSKDALLNACRKIIELTRYIDLESYTPIWVMLSAPMSASFIIFDFIVHNPAHPDTKCNLSLLGVAAGYFFQLEYVSGGAIPTSPLSDMAAMGRDYIRQMGSGSASETTVSDYTEEMPWQPSEVSMQSQNNLSVPGPSSHMDEMFPASTGLENLYHPVDNVDFSTWDRLPGGIDLMELFTTGFPDGVQSFARGDPA